MRALIVILLAGFSFAAVALPADISPDPDFAIYVVAGSDLALPAELAPDDKNVPQSEYEALIETDGGPLVAGGEPIAAQIERYAVDVTHKLAYAPTSRAPPNW